MKQSIFSKIKKLIMALRIIYKKIYLCNREQNISKKTGKPYSILKLYQAVPVDEYYNDEYYIEHPRAKRKKREGTVKVEVLSDFDEVNILLYLVQRLKEAEQEKLKAGDGNGESKQ